MKVFRPAFYKEFQCIGSACTDTCCALWEIEVDEESAERYAADEGPLAEDFRKYLVRKEDENYFRLTAEKRCPFLNEQNLCRMILTMGEDALCDICREHPRFYHWFGDYTEVGLGLCCEEAGRFLFSSQEPLDFELLSDGEDFEAEEYEEEDYWIELLLGVRACMIAMLQDRRWPLHIRYRKMLALAEQMQPFLDEEDADGLDELLEHWKREGMNLVTGSEADGSWSGGADRISRLQEMVAFYGSLESLDQTWPDRMKQLREKLPELAGHEAAFSKALKEAGRDVDFEHLLVYSVFRYFMEAVFDSNILSPVRFAAASLQMIALLDLEDWVQTGSFCMADQIRNAKWYSKEIEYCPDNMELLTEKLEVDGSWL